MTQSLFNWCQDLEMALQNGGEHDPELRTARLEMAAEWLRRYARAEEILRRGSAVTGVREAEHIAGRLADICGRTGRPDEARQFRQQAEKERQRAGQRAPRATAWAAPTTPTGESRAAKQRTAPAGKTGRNQPCPCGSGKKFNKCCGAPASA